MYVISKLINKKLFLDFHFFNFFKNISTVIKNLDTLHKEVQLNGYLKVDNFVSNSDAEILENAKIKSI